jgi:TolB-like protein/tetratricopeptide (TPR) repeat protein
MHRPSRQALRPLLGLYQELARRHVVRVAVAYVVVSWLILQVASTILPAMGADEASLRWVLVVLAIGLPVALVTSWYFDLTPEGIRLTGDAPGGDLPRPLVGAASASDQPADPASLAVLAFADRSESRDQEFLAKGISEELINLLGRVGGLRIAPRSSAFAFEGRSLDVREVGRHLNVAHVVDGSVRKSGERIRIAVELIDVVDGYTKWMNTYDRDAVGVFGVQEEIARSIVAEIRGQLLAGVVRLDPGTRSTEAYDAYLMGRHYWNSRYAVGLEKSIECFSRAAQIDPDYALPLSGLADAYNLLAYYNFVAPRDGFAKAGGFARRAQSLAPHRAETNSSLAFVQQYSDWNFAAAETGFRRALDANASYGPARFWFAYLQATLGRTDDALLQIEAARAAEPFSAMIHGGASYLDFMLGRHAQGLQLAQEVLSLDPNFGPAHMFLGFHWLAMGNPGEAVASWRAAVARLDRLLLAQAMLAASLATAGEKAEARRILLQLDNVSGAYVSSYYRAIAALALGEHDVALTCLERALEERNGFLTQAGMDPLLAPLHDEPRFGRIIEQVGVPLLRRQGIQRTA